MNIAGLLHVNINCRDFDRSKAFYEKLGFRVLMPINQDEEGALAEAVGMRNYRIRGALMRSRDGTIIDLLEWQHPCNEEPPYGALNHLGLARLAFVTKDLDGDIAALEEEGVAFLSDGPATAATPDGGVSRFICFKDPDGTVLELVEITPPEKA